MANVALSLAGKLYVQSAYGADPVIQYSADYMRRVLGSFYNVAGALHPTELFMTQNGAGDWSFNLSAGTVVIPGATNEERYMYYSPAINVSVSGLATSPPATRTHKVYMAAYDKNYGSATSEPKLWITEDTGGTMNPPTGAVGYVQLGTISIAPSQTSIQTSNIVNFTPLAGFRQYWTTFTAGQLASGIIDGSGGSFPPQWQRVGNTVRLRGQLTRNPLTNFPPGNFTVISTMPTAIKPITGRIEYHPIAIQYSAAADPTAARITISDTNMVVQLPTAANANSVWLDGIMYDVS